MTTPIQHSWTYPAPLAAVRAMLIDPAFRERVCDAQHAISRTVQIQGATDAETLEIEYAQATDRAPALVKKLVGDSITISQREQWAGPEATLEIRVPGKPGTAAGRCALIDHGDSTTQEVTLEVTAKVPLVGGKVEGVIRDLLLKAFQRESQVGLAWLQESSEG